MPKACTVTNFNDFKPYLIPLINKIIPEVFEGIKGFDTSTLKIKEHDLVFEESYEKNKEITKGNALTWIVVLLVFVLVILVIMSSIGAWYFKKENEQ